MAVPRSVGFSLIDYCGHLTRNGGHTAGGVINGKHGLDRVVGSRPRNRLSGRRPRRSGGAVRGLLGERAALWIVGVVLLTVAAAIGQGLTRQRAAPETASQSGHSPPTQEPSPTSSVTTDHPLISEVDAVETARGLSRSLTVTEIVEVRRGSFGNLGPHHGVIKVPAPGATPDPLRQAWLVVLKGTYMGEDCNQRCQGFERFHVDVETGGLLEWSMTLADAP